MSKKTPDTDESTHREELATAAEWLVRLEDPGTSQELYCEWLQWIEAEHNHEKAFDEVARFSNRLTSIREEFADFPLPGDKELAADDYDPTEPVSRWLERKPNSSNTGTGGRYVLAAAVAIAAAGLAIVLGPEMGVNLGDSQTYGFETIASQHNEALLDDGSKIDIGADSALTVNFSREQRTVVFEKGEALFSVAKDAERPFVVVAGSGTITAIGTEFNVRRDSERVVVTVTEGSVEVSQFAEPTSEGRPDFSTAVERNTQPATKLQVGEQVAYDALGLTPVSMADPAVATSWRDGRLQYLREPLQYVVTGVNRYSDLTIVIADSEINDLLFTGTVFDGQSREWLEGLANVLPVEVEYVGNNTALLKKVDKR